MSVTSGPLKAELRSSHISVREFVKSLVTENARLHRRIARLETAQITQQNQIAELNKEFARIGHKKLSDLLSDRLNAAKKRALNQPAKT